MTKSKLLKLFLISSVVLTGGLGSLFALTKPVYAVGDGTCTIRFYAQGDPNRTPITTNNPQVGHSYGIIASAAFYDQSGWPGVLDNGNQRTARFSIFRNLPFSSDEVTVGTTATYKDGNWTSDSTFTVVESAGSTFKVVFKVKNPGSNPLERDICGQDNVSVEARTDGIADGQGGCCSTDFQCSNKYGSASTCAGNNGQCNSGKICQGGNDPIANGGVCDVTGSYYKCQNTPNYQCVFDGSKISSGKDGAGNDAGKCQAACTTMECLSARYNKSFTTSSGSTVSYSFDASDPRKGANSVSSNDCLFDVAHLVTIKESIYENGINSNSSCDPNQCSVYHLTSFPAPSGNTATFNMCFAKASDCSTRDSEHLCDITPNPISDNGDINVRITSQCLEPSSYKIIVQNTPDSADKLQVYASKSFTISSSAAFTDLTLAGVPHVDGDPKVHIIVQTAGSPTQLRCEFYDTAYFSNPKSPIGEGTNPNENHTGTESTDFGSKNCPFPAPTPGVCPANDISCNSGITPPPTSDNRTPDQVDENKQCKACVDLGNTWTAIGCINTSISGIFTELVRIALGVMSGVVLLRMIYLGYIYQSGDTGKIAEARSGVIATIAGIVVVVFSVVILRVIGVNVLDIVPKGFFGVG